MDSTITPAQEVAQINQVFRAHAIRANIDPTGSGSLLTPQYWAYNVRIATAEKPERVQALHRTITETITRFRQRPTPVRITSAPLTIEVPALQPRPIYWSSATLAVGAHRMIAGKKFDIFSGEQQVVIDLDKQYHSLVAGATGAGKSVLLQMLLLSLATNTLPSQIEFWFCDLKNDDLRKLKNLPHVRHVATDERSAAALIDRLYAEKEHRKATHDYSRRILLVVDEQAELAPLTAAVQQMNSILSVGRSIGINVLIATQEPTKAVLGGLSTRNFSVRLVGAVADARAAGYASGRAGTGAELLARPGGFLSISGPDVVRFQSYLIPEEQIDPVVAAIRKEWAHQPVDAHNAPSGPQPLVYQPTGPVAPAATAPTALLPFEQPVTDQAISLCVQTYAAQGTLNKTIALLWPTGDKLKRLAWLKGALTARGVTYA